MMRKSTSKPKTKRKVTAKQKANLIPFKSGYDPRRNTKGRPKGFDQLRALFQEIAADEITVDGKTMTRAEAIGIMMTTSPDKFKDFLEFAYGKVPLSQIVKVDDTKQISWKEFINGGVVDSDSGS